MSSTLTERKLINALFTNIEKLVDDNDDSDLHKHEFNDIMKCVSSSIANHNDIKYLSDLCKYLILRLQSIHKIKNVIYILDKTTLLEGFLRIYADEFNSDKMIQIIKILKEYHTDYFNNDSNTATILKYKNIDQVYQHLPFTQTLLGKSLAEQKINIFRHLILNALKNKTLNESHFKYVDRLGRNVFHYIQNLDDFQLVEAFFNQNNILDFYKRNIIQNMIDNNSSDELILYILNKYDKYNFIENCDLFGENVLFMLIYKKNLKLLKKILQKYPGALNIINQQNHIGETILFNAVIQKDETITDYLIDRFYISLGSSRCYQIVSDLIKNGSITNRFVCSHIDSLESSRLFKKQKLNPNKNIIKSYTYINNVYFNTWLFLNLQKKHNYNYKYLELFTNNNLGFNLSHIDIGDNQYIFCLRIEIKEKYQYEIDESYNFMNMENDIIKPGYSLDEEDDEDKKDIKKYNESLGKNFMWNNWGIDFRTYGFIFKAHYINGELIINKTINPIISTEMGYDMRLYKFKDRLYLADTLLENLYEINPSNLHCDHVNINLNEKCHFTENDKNLIIYDNQCFLICDFFRNGLFEYLIITNTDSDKFSYLRHHIPCGEMNTNKNIIFSFGTPFYTLTNDGITYDKLAVGHIKYANSVNTKDPKVEKFRHNLDTYLTQKFGKNYIKHYNFRRKKKLHGYTYLMYFMRMQISLKDGQKHLKFYISPAFYPINVNSGNKYGFSLVFPAGLSIDGDSIFVSSGEGDYYNSIIEFDKNSVIKMTNIDIEHFKHDGYDYHIYEF